MSRVGRGLAGSCASRFGVISIGALLIVRNDCVRGLEVSVPYLEPVEKVLVTLSLQWDWIPIDEVQ
jgi:hypothetical protein